MSAKFDHFDIVILEKESHRELSEEPEGVILGMVIKEEGRWTYVVHVYDSEETEMFEEAEPRATGRKERRENIWHLEGHCHE